MYVDAEHLEPLAQAQISQQAKARIVDTAMAGYGVLVPEDMVMWNGQPAIAWWQLDLNTGEVIGVGEDGTHQFIALLPAEILFVQQVVGAIWAVARAFLSLLARPLVWRVMTE